MIPIYTPNQEDRKSFDMSTDEDIIAEKLKETKKYLEIVEPYVPIIESRKRSSQSPNYSTKNIVPRLKLATEQLRLPALVGYRVYMAASPVGILTTMALGIYRTVRTYA